MEMSLGAVLSAAREANAFSLRHVAREAEIAPTYLQKLERDEVGEPSPNVLFRLSDALRISYAELMKLAGYIVPEERGRGPSGSEALASALRSSDLTSEEIEEMARYLGYLRVRRKRGGDG